MNQAPSPKARGGRDRLLKAALRLSAKHRSIASVGLRELAREAGLHHTAMYRHFSSIEDVAIALVDILSAQLRADLRHARRSTRTGLTDMIRSSTRRYFEYVEQHPQGVIFCARELHGALPALREALHGMLDDFAQDSAEDLKLLRLSEPLPDEERIGTLTRLIAHNNLFAALDYLEFPQERELVVARSTCFAEWLVAGASATAQHGPGP